MCVFDFVMKELALLAAGKTHYKKNWSVYSAQLLDFIVLLDN